MGWIELENFQGTLTSFWENLSSKVGERDILDWWNFMSSGLRQKLNGWSANKGIDAKLHKQALLAQIKGLDEKADSVGLEEAEWEFRYHLEEQLLEIFRVEEEYWRQRGRVRWLLKETLTLHTSMQFPMVDAENAILLVSFRLRDRLRTSA
jgi:hypothetical protein